VSTLWRNVLSFRWPRPDAVFARLAVDVREVVGIGVERHELRPTVFGPLSQEVVEHGLPRLAVDTRGVGEHAIGDETSFRGRCEASLERVLRRANMVDTAVFSLCPESRSVD
jgi:hypothetical protein